MCIMEVRAGQRDSTIAQACAHNVATVVGDLDMFETVLTARLAHDTADGRLDTEAALGQVRHAHDTLRRAYADLLGLFGAEVGRALTHWQAGEDHGDDHHGHERDHVTSDALVAVADADRKRARKFETR